MPLAFGMTYKWKANPSGDYEFDFDVGGTLADAAQWQGAKGDLRFAAPGVSASERPTIWAGKYYIRSYVDPSSAPSADKVATWHLGTSDSSTAGTRNDGGLSGATETYANTQDSRHDNMIFLGNNTFDNSDVATWATLPTLELLPTPYIMPLIDNNLGQTIADEGIELWLTEILDAS